MGTHESREVRDHPDSHRATGLADVLHMQQAVSTELGHEIGSQGLADESAGENRHVVIVRLFEPVAEGAGVVLHQRPYGSVVDRSWTVRLPLPSSRLFTGPLSVFPTHEGIIAEITESPKPDHR